MMREPNGLAVPVCLANLAWQRSFPGFSGRAGHRGAGFGLVEIMIAIALGLILVSSLLALYASQKSSALVEASVNALQDDVLFASDLIARDIRASGDFGCNARAETVNTLSDKVIKIDSNTVPAKGFANYAAVPDDLHGYSALKKNNPVKNSPILMLSGAYGGVTHLRSKMAGTNTRILVASAEGFERDDLVMVSNCRNAALLKLTGVKHDENIMTHGVDLGHAFGVGADVVQVDTIWYAICQPEGKPKGLYRVRSQTGVAQLITEKIEKWQLRYVRDANNDLILDEGSLTAAEVGADWTNIAAVGVEMVLRSDKPVSGTPQTSYYFDGQKIAVDDSFSYRVVATQTRLRNI
jgi:type IV pilus assembly protein PilW